MCLNGIARKPAGESYGCVPKELPGLQPEVDGRCVDRFADDVRTWLWETSGCWQVYSLLVTGKCARCLKEFGVWVMGGGGCED